MIQLILEALLSDFQNISYIGHAQEVLHIMETIRLCIGIRELCIDLGLAKGLACHLEETNEIVVLACTVGDLDDLGEVRWVGSLNVRVYGLNAY